MIVSLLVVGLGAAAAIAVGVAFYKHKTLAAVEVSAKAELAIVEAEITKLGAAASADLKAAYAKLKAIF